jgi:phage terminase large subunit
MEIRLKKKIFNPVYFPHLMDYSKRYEVYYGGAGSGKSVFIAQKLVYRALRSKRKILVLRKVNSTTKNSTFALLIKTLSDWKLINYCKVNKSDFTITLPNNSQFLCMGLDDPEKLKSIAGITDAWLEEATEFTQDDFNQVDLRIREQVDNSQIILSFNPVSKANWCYFNFFKPNEELEEFRSQCTIVQTTYKDNKFLPNNYIKTLQMMMATNPVYYKIYALGEFGSLDKLVYNNWQSYDFDHTKLKGKLCIGLDFGYVNDPTAIIASIVNQEDKRIYIFQEMVEEGLLNDEIGRKIIDLGFKKSDIIADSAEQKSIEEIKRMGIPRIAAAAKGPDSIIHGINHVSEYEIVVHPSCVRTIEELQNYSWQKDKATNEYINKPVDKFNHCLDALRYSLQCLDIRPRLQTMSKDALF